jgi:hypothetical protein
LVAAERAVGGELRVGQQRRQLPSQLHRGSPSPPNGHELRFSPINNRHHPRVSPNTRRVLIAVNKSQASPVLQSVSQHRRQPFEGAHVLASVKPSHRCLLP